MTYKYCAITFKRIFPVKLSYVHTPSRETLKKKEGKISVFSNFKNRYSSDSHEGPQLPYGGADTLSSRFRFEINERQNRSMVEEPLPLSFE